MQVAKIVAAALLAGLFAWTEATAADFISAVAEGWYTWQLDGAALLTESCCSTEAGQVQVYVLIKNSRPSKIRVLSSECPVSTKTKLTDLGVISPSENIEWFRSVIEDAGTSQGIREEALYGLVQSRSDAAFEYIDRLLSRRE